MWPFDREEKRLRRLLGEHKVWVKHLVGMTGRLKLRNFRLAHENDRLKALLAQSHYRNPETGRMSPLGHYDLEVQ